MSAPTDALEAALEKAAWALLEELAEELGQPVPVTLADTILTALLAAQALQAEADAAICDARAIEHRYEEHYAPTGNIAAFLDCSASEAELLAAAIRAQAPR